MRILITGICIVVVALGIAGALWYNSSSSEVLIEHTDDGLSGLSNLFAQFKSDTTPKPLTVAVFGRPGAGYKSGSLADAILIIHYDPAQKTAHMISIPRDLWITDGTEQFKLNEIIFRNKVGAGLAEFEKMTGLSMDGYLDVDLTTIQKGIDDLGGVDIVLDQTAIDWVSGFRMEAGNQHLNGEDAVWLIRNRYNAQGDFFREKNQQKIIDAALLKFKALTRDEKVAFVKKYLFDGKLLRGAHVDIAQITPLIFDVNLSVVKLKSVVMDFSTKLFKNASVPIQTEAGTSYIAVVLPVEGFQNYAAIQKYIQTQIILTDQ